MNHVFTIKTAAFEGPLDLLLSLIEKRKLFINDISLSKVADDYIEYIKTFENFPVGITAHFILIASTLLLIKSKSLLPTLALTPEEEGSIEDLETRLKLYKRFKELAIKIEKRFGKSIIFPRLPNKNIPIVFSPEDSITAKNILEVSRSVIQSLPKEEILPKGVVMKMISLEEMIGRLAKRVELNIKMSFGEFAKTQGKSRQVGAKHTTSKEDRVNIIISFLAMLELVKQGVISVTQQKHTDDIDIETENLKVPNYN